MSSNLLSNGMDVSCLGSTARTSQWFNIFQRAFRERVNPYDGATQDHLSKVDPDTKCNYHQALKAYAGCRVVPLPDDDDDDFDYDDDIDDDFETDPDEIDDDDDDDDDEEDLV